MVHLRGGGEGGECPQRQNVNTFMGGSFILCIHFFNLKIYK